MTEPKRWTNVEIEVLLPLDTPVDGKSEDKQKEAEHFMAVVQDALGVNAAISGRWVDVEIDENDDLIELPRHRPTDPASPSEDA